VISKAVVKHLNQQTFMGVWLAISLVVMAVIKMSNLLMTLALNSVLISD
jgi:hypothetical protein